MAKAKKKKATKKSGSSKNVTLEKASENVEKIEESKSEKKAEDTKASKTSEKKSSDKKVADKKNAEKKPSVFAKISKYFRECRSEIKKIVWPTPQATFKNVGIVLSVLLVVGLFVYGLDTGFIALLKLVMNY